MTDQAQLSRALECAYESMRGRMDIQFQDFKNAVKDWEINPVFVSGEIVGAVLVKDSEIHACVKREGFCRWFGKPMLKILNRTILKHGYATTSVSAGNMIGHEFVSRLGFEKIGTRADVWIYRKD